MPQRFFLYARKSTESEDRQVLSIDSQIKELKNHAEKAGIQIVEEFRESKSAKAPGRPVFSEMMALLEKQKAEGVLCWKLDRLARNPVDGGALIWALDQGKIKQIVTPFRTFQKSGDDAFWMQLEFGMAKKYVDDLSENVKRGLKAKAELGEPPASRLPLGYMRDLKSGGVIADPDRFPLVQRIFQEVARGCYRPIEVLEMATRDWGLTTISWGSKGGGLLSKSAFYKVLGNPFYTGVFTHNGEVYRGNFPAMVSVDDFKKVQQILRRPDNPKPRKGHEFAYRGLFHCGTCGARLVAEAHTNRYGSHYVHYHCPKKRPWHEQCPERALEERGLENQIAEFLRRFQIPPHLLQWATDHLSGQAKEENSWREIEKQAQKKSLRSVERQLGTLTRMRLQEQIGEEEFVAERKRLLFEKEGLAKTAELEKHPCKPSELLLRAFSFATLAKKRFEDGDKFTRRKILLGVGQNFLLKDRKVLIEAKKPFQLLLERPQCLSRCAWIDYLETFLHSEDTYLDLRSIPDLEIEYDELAPKL